jgi:hypothetical protein
VIVWSDDGLETGTQLRELVRFVRWLLRGA